MRKPNSNIDLIIHVATIAVGIIAWRLLNNILGLVVAVIIGVAISGFLQKRNNKEGGEEQ